MLKTFLCCFGIATWAISPAVAGTIDYSLTGDWSDTANPNGPWTYRQGGDTLSLVSDYNFGSTVGGFTPQAAWAPSNVGGHFLPVWLQSIQTGTPSGFESGAVLPGDVIVHSTDSGNGSGEGIANVIWTSPEAGTIDISGSISWIRSLGRTNDFSISVGGTVIADGSIGDGSVNTRSNPLQFASGLFTDDSFADITVSAGEVVELEVTQAPGSPAGEISNVNFEIDETTATTAPTTTPEPGSLSLLGVALICASALVLRRRV